MVGVFLSHSSKDKPFVRDLAAALEAEGEMEVWLDEREIDYGENILLKIADGLDADFVLLILSPDSVNSKWVKEEWTDAYWEQPVNREPRMAMG
jgi:TIR domain